MFGSVVLEVAIGMVFIYLLLSLVSSAASELLEGLLKNRAKDLERGLQELLQNPSLVEAVYKHPLVNGLFRGTYDPQKTKTNLPSYIPAESFAVAVMDAVKTGEWKTMAAAVGGSPKDAGTVSTSPVVKFIEEASADATNGQERLAGWFNASMERVSGWYKRRTQVFIFAISLIIAVLINADSIAIANGLANDRALRDSLVAAAQTYSRENQPAQNATPAADAARPVTTPAASAPVSGPAVPAGPAAADKHVAAADARMDQNLKMISSLGLPIGWEGRDVPIPGRIPTDTLGWLVKLVGCLVTACAASLGAPFWFDTLNRIINLRSALKPKEA